MRRNDNLGPQLLFRVFLPHQGVVKVVSPNEIVRWLLDEHPACLVTEASVHLPRRSKIWVATYAGPEPRKQVWRSTGLTNRLQALIVARKWEALARQQRAAWNGFRKSVLRVQQSDPGSGLSQEQVARLFKMSVRGVRAVERRAFRKLRNHPRLKEIWRQLLAGELDERKQPQCLTHAENEPTASANR